MTPDKRRLVKTTLWILGIMAAFTAAVWITLFVTVRPARGQHMDLRAPTEPSHIPVLS
jgi:hypothetical protein